ncbi:hypothetical protein E2C01_097384 [Portunus trituberculatus]|uniref:Uncharacterized protein n=1 Tax=Portunus trituberculatus TaxID=210409 RepID=A0A5B7K9T5_PORTR|nr:hypothetical protein [Portunus trituberculatus]
MQQLPSTSNHEQGSGRVRQEGGRKMSSARRLSTIRVTLSQTMVNLAIHDPATAAILAEQTRHLAYRYVVSDWIEAPSWYSVHYFFFLSFFC